VTEVLAIPCVKSEIGGRAQVELPNREPALDFLRSLGISEQGQDG